MTIAIYGSSRINAPYVFETAHSKLRKGFFTRLVDALRESKRRQAEREIAKYAHLLAPYELRCK